MNSPLTTTRLRKSASDNGFDLEEASFNQWLPFMSTRVPLKVWLTGTDGQSLTAALSQENVADELDEYGSQTALVLPSGAVAGRDVADFNVLHRLLRRAFQLSRTLPDQLLHEFLHEASDLPRSTEVERLVVQRVGQDFSRQALIDYWEGRCAVTGLDVAELLRASHSKPWADYDDDAERLDVFNGFLLAPHLDALFDRGFVTIANDGAVILAACVSVAVRRQLCLADGLHVARLTDAHRKYLSWHREHVFRESSYQDGHTS